VQTLVCDQVTAYLYDFICVPSGAIIYSQNLIISESSDLHARSLSKIRKAGKQEILEKRLSLDPAGSLGLTPFDNSPLQK